MDTVLAVYIGTNYLNLQFVTCDNNSAPDGLRSVVRFPATAGVEYKVAVDTVGGVSGTIQVNWGIGSAPTMTSRRRILQPRPAARSHLTSEQRMQSQRRNINGI